MRRVRSMAILAAGVAMAALSTPATAEPERERVAVNAIETTASASIDYWTPETMRAAVPMDRIVAERVSSVAEAVGETTTEVARGVPETISPVRPLALPTDGQPWTGGGEVAETAGRVFFTFDGSPASCSGNAVTSANRSVIMTAGHCVKYQGSWHTNWIFVPGYDDGAAPFGEWPARLTLTTPQWEASEDINYDVGAAVVSPLGGEYLTDVIGAQGIAFNQPRGQDMYAFGYPAADPYDGSELIHCSGSTFTDPFLSSDHGMRCDMTGGSSGGPWFLDFDEASGLGVQSSVNSFGYTFLPGYMFGPYFGAEAQALHAEAEAA